MIEVLVLIAAVFVLLFYIYHLLKSKSRPGILVTSTGNKYNYYVGDSLFSQSVEHNGMVVTLHKILPQMYLDSHTDSKYRGTQVTYHNSQRLMLEGDFNNYFQLFAPTNFQTLVLSIITPDIMQTIVNTGGKYDIEIKGNQLAIISRQRINMNAKKVSELQAIALRLIEEIEHKMTSWGANNEEEARRAELTFDKEESIKLRGRYFGIFRLSVIVSVLLGGIFYALAFLNWNNEAAEPIMLLALAILFLPGGPVILTRLR